MTPLFLLLFQQSGAIPDFIHGEECLFCHRNDVGSGWQTNRHGLTVNEKPGSEEFTLGAGKHSRRLKKSGYNQFSIFEPRQNRWDDTKFANQCAGCHTTAMDPVTKTFAYYGLDCYTCHGVVDLNHTGNTALMLLSRKRRGEPAVITSICASCHLRGGKSKRTGRPYPAAFVPGSDLFGDFQVDLSPADSADVNPGDRHVYRSVRDVRQGGATTCIHCHTVHTGSTERHRRVLSGAICNDCHYEGRPRKQVRPYTMSSEVCEY